MVESTLFYSSINPKFMQLFSLIKFIKVLIPNSFFRIILFFHSTMPPLINPQMYVREEPEVQTKI